MSGSVVWKFKLWFVWQDEQHQRWLEQQASAGLHLVDTNSVGLHKFRRGAPADVVYRWDMGCHHQDPQYRQLFEDAGWELVATASHWHCWRKPRQPGQTNEIFTDAAGKLGKYRRVMVTLGVAILFQVLPVWVMGAGRYWAALNGRNEDLQGLFVLLLWMGPLAVLLCLYGMLRLALRMRRLVFA